MSETSTPISEALEVPSPPTTETPSLRRLVSLDAFRGATLALMVLVNNAGDGGHVYAPLRHAEWHGWTPTDVVFPSFLWIVGVATTLSLGKKIAAGVSRAQLFSQVFKRALILYGLGLLVYAFPHFNFSTLRLLGVLQRIAICYLIATAIYLASGIRAQIAWIMGLLFGYWLIMQFAPVPGLAVAGQYDLENNFAHYVDRLVLGAHNYQSTKTWDPEGLVSTLPAIATALLGIMAGHIMAAKRHLSERTMWLFAVGNLLIAAGLLCNIWMPINKKLWTSSFALFMGGLDFVIFAMFVFLIDGLGYKRVAKPLVIMGMNAITVYMISELLDEIFSAVHVAGGISLRGWIYQMLFAPLASAFNASLLYAMTYTFLMFAIAFVMHRRGWFVRI